MPSVNADAEDAPSAASGVKVDHYNQKMKSAVEFSWLGQAIYSKGKRIECLL